MRDRCRYSTVINHRLAGQADIVQILNYAASYYPPVMPGLFLVSVPAAVL